MRDRTFSAFFTAATGHPEHPPYAYQCRLACGPAARADQPETLTTGCPCESRLINIPTGLGKTAAVVLAWLWNRVAHPEATHRDTWPRRLVYCLPMRTLVEQTESAVLTWLKALNLSDHVGVHILMGGEDHIAMRDWDLRPERPAILIGTQDMLLSRALNRGYGLSRYRWPMHFALLNNDVLWVFDELQLMGVSVETSAQLNAFRRKLGMARDSHSWWMSATLDSKRLHTVDHAASAATLAMLELDPAERESGPVKRRIASTKILIPASVSLSKVTEKNYEKQLADHILAVHTPGTFTLVIVNRVPRAREIFHLLQKAASKHPKADRPELALIHSRFRPRDRANYTAILTDRSLTHKIVIATQAIEAGVDVSAKTLVTELAPWSSLVQRFGRCNRAGEHTDPALPATIHWIDIDPAGKEDLALPYEADELAAARTALRSLSAVGPSALAAVSVAPREVVRPVIRRKDFIELFDTTPDIAGHDLDISRYIREGDDTDAQVAWRALGKDGVPASTDPRPSRDELCRVPVHSLNEFLKKQKAEAFVWSPLARAWEPQRSVRPGVLCVLDAQLGGYDNALGWTADKKSEVTPLSIPTPSEDQSGADEASYEDTGDAQTGAWQSIAEHTADVERELKCILDALPASSAETTALTAAARLHDVGKSHPSFQARLKPDALASPEAAAHRPIAKAPRFAWKPRSVGAAPEDRPLFRHELASALALLAHPQLVRADNPDLVTYLIATHHGKVRLSIRSLPGEKAPPSADQRFARGIWENDALPTVPLSDGTEFPATVLSLACMELGSRDDGQTRSWLARMLALRDAPDLGPLRLAWLEALLRAADMRASALADSAAQLQSPAHELAANRHSLAHPVPTGETASPLGEHPGPGGAEHGFRERAGGRAEPARETRPEHATRHVETSRGLLSYAALAPILAERVQAVETELSAGVFAELPLADTFLLELHRRIVGELVPDWAGRWRLVEVTVGRLAPPPPHLVPEHMRNYGLDLQARWPDAATNLGDRTLEFLAFAEGRFLTIHPFRDFNGRTIRVFLGELLRRLDLPPVNLEAEGETARATYFSALEAADTGDFRPLMTIWRDRLSAEV